MNIYLQNGEWGIISEIRTNRGTHLHAEKIYGASIEGMSPLQLSFYDYSTEIQVDTQCKIA